MFVGIYYLWRPTAMEFHYTIMAWADLTITMAGYKWQSYGPKIWSVILDAVCWWPIQLMSVAATGYYGYRWLEKRGNCLGNLCCLTLGTLHLLHVAGSSCRGGEEKEVKPVWRWQCCWCGRALWVMWTSAETYVDLPCKLTTVWFHYMILYNMRWCIYVKQRYSNIQENLNKLHNGIPPAVGIYLWHFFKFWCKISWCECNKINAYSTRCMAKPSVSPPGILLF